MSDVVGQFQNQPVVVGGQICLTMGNLWLNPTQTRFTMDKFVGQNLLDSPFFTQNRVPGPMGNY